MPTSWSPSPPASSGQPEELRPVAPEEPLTGRLVEPRHCVAERLEGAPAALGMRVVRREHEELRPALLNQPRRVLEGEGREADLPAQVFGRKEVQLLEHRLELRER